MHGTHGQIHTIENACVRLVIQDTTPNIIHYVPLTRLKTARKKKANSTITVTEIMANSIPNYTDIRRMLVLIRDMGELETSASDFSQELGFTWTVSQSR